MCNVYSIVKRIVVAQCKCVLQVCNVNITSCFGINMYTSVLLSRSQDLTQLPITCSAVTAPT